MSGYDVPLQRRRLLRSGIRSIVSSLGSFSIPAVDRILNAV
jgi:hypothetical protein